jgi:hypothetical protein
MKEPILLFFTPTEEEELPKKRKIVLKPKQFTRQDWITFGGLSAAIVLLMAVSITHLQWSPPVKSRTPVKEGTTQPGAVQATVETDATSGPMTSLPVVGKAKLQLESANNVDALKVVMEPSADSSPVKYSYEWTKNGEVAGNQESVTGFRRGDIMAVTITPFEGKVAGQPRTLSMEIKNSPPKIVGVKDTSIQGDVLSCIVNGADPDGDELTYSLAKAPPGMTIDGKSGLLKWQIPKDSAERCHVEVKVSDGHGGEGIWPMDITVSQNPVAGQVTQK